MGDKDSAMIARVAEDNRLLEIGRLAVEKELIAFRDSRMSEPFRGNGLVIREKDGMDSHVIRFGPETALRVALRAIARELGRGPRSVKSAGRGG